MKPTVMEQATGGATVATPEPTPPDPQTHSPRQRQRLAEDAIAAIEAEYNVRVMGVVKTVSGVNGPVQVIGWEVAALPDAPAGGG